jgi:hypothetical protein
MTGKVGNERMFVCVCVCVCVCFQKGEGERIYFYINLCRHFYLRTCFLQFAGFGAVDGEAVPKEGLGVFVHTGAGGGGGVGGTGGLGGVDCFDCFCVCV